MEMSTQQPNASNSSFSNRFTYGVLADRKFFERYESEDETFLDSIVTDDET